jgi:hypothetical protein
MKFTYLALSVLIYSIVIAANTASAASSLVNCAAGTKAEFFASDLEQISAEGKTPVLLFNDKDEVVGLITAVPERAPAYPYETSKVMIEKVDVCGTFEVTDFYYTDGPSGNLLAWTAKKTGRVYVYRDEGQIVIDAKVGKKETYATRIDVDFKAYDVMTEIESYTSAQRKSADFETDWGLPKGKGSFHFFVPANWKLEP